MKLAVDSGVETLTYAELHEAALELAGRLAEVGVGPGTKVGIRIKSGTTDLYVAIIGTLMAGLGGVAAGRFAPAVVHGLNLFTR